MRREIQLPEAYERDIRRAVEILTGDGCTGVYLFGSLVSGEIQAGSDIDLAVRGCPRGRFFHLLGKLMLELEHPVDLVNLDKQDAFAQYLEQEGELIQVG